MRVVVIVARVAAILVVSRQQGGKCGPPLLRAMLLVPLNACSRGGAAPLRLRLSVGGVEIGEGGGELLRSERRKRLRCGQCPMSAVVLEALQVTGEKAEA